jgi:hypothetical protein
LFVIAGVTVFLIWKFYKRKLSKRKPIPDPKFALGEIRNRRLNVHFEGALPTENNVASHMLPKNSDNDLSLATTVSEVEDTKPSSLTSLLISVPRNHHKESFTDNDSIGDKKSNVEEIETDLPSSSNSFVNKDPEFNSIGVDTRGLKRPKKKKRGAKKTHRPRFRLRRSKSSVADSSSAIRGTKDDAQTSRKKAAPSLVCRAILI